MCSREQPDVSTSASSPFQCWEYESSPIAKSLRDHTVYIAQKHCTPQCPSAQVQQPNRFGYIEQAYKIYSQEHANTCPIPNQCLDIAGFTVWLQKKYDNYLEDKHQASEKATQTLGGHTPREVHNSDEIICNSPWSQHVEKKKHKAFRFRSPWKRHHHSNYDNVQLPNQVTPSELQGVCQPLSQDNEAMKTEQCPLLALEHGVSRECCNVVPKQSYSTATQDLVCPVTGPPPRTLIEDGGCVYFPKNSNDRNGIRIRAAAASADSSKRLLDRNMVRPNPPCASDQQRRAPSGEVTCLMQPPRSPERNWNFSSGEDRRCDSSPKTRRSKHKVICSATLKKQQKKHRKKSPQVICSPDCIEYGKSNTPSAVSSMPFSPNSTNTYCGPTCFYNTQIYQDWQPPESTPQQPFNKTSNLPKGDCEVQTSDHSISLNANPNQPIYFMKIVFADELKKW